MIFRLFLLSLFLITGFVNAAEARVDILPRKIVMEQRDRSAEVTILNLYDQPSLYRISFIHYRQGEDGAYEPIEMPLSSDFDPEKIVRLSPRQFQVSPGGRQKIRLSIRKPENLPDGEYRFHLLAQRNEVGDSVVRKKELKPGAQTINIKVNVGVAIPVVIRHGETNVSASIGDVSFVPKSQNEGNRLIVNINREGNASSIGMLEIFTGDERIGFISNCNIFTEINKRVLSVPVSKDPRGQQVRIVYTADNGEIFDEKNVQP